MLKNEILRNQKWRLGIIRHAEDFYNHNRPHAALGGKTPYERLREKVRLSV